MSDGINARIFVEGSWMEHETHATVEDARASARRMARAEAKSYAVESGETETATVTLAWSDACDDAAVESFEDVTATYEVKS